MNREIKFRAWDKEEKSFVTKVFNMLLRIGEKLENERFEFMQYTGLKDKNGKEIYEGDIVGYCAFLGYYDFDSNGTPNSEAEWESGRVVISYDIAKTRFLTPFTETENLPMKLDPESFEIIGNIYENKDLLK